MEGLRGREDDPTQQLVGKNFVANHAAGPKCDQGAVVVARRNSCCCVKIGTQQEEEAIGPWKGLMRAKKNDLKRQKV